MQVSLNQKIKRFIEGEIEAGTWPVGTRIPSEAQLARQFGASRMTVNRAVKELTERGWLSRVQGSGTFVSDRATHAPLFEIQSIREEILARGQVHACHVGRLERRAISRADATRSGLTEGSEGFYLEAVHTADGRPIQLERRFVNAAVAPAFISQDFGTVTASEYLLRHVPYAEVEHRVEAIPADPALAQALGLEANSACLRLVRRTFTLTDLITHVELVHPGDRFSLTGRFAGAATPARVA